MAMIAITTRSSISVNPRDLERFARFDMFVLLMLDVADLDDLLLQSNPIPPPWMRKAASFYHHQNTLRRNGTQRLRCSMGRCSRRGSLKAAFRWWYQATHA
jgi:hypothetical protein